MSIQKSNLQTQNKTYEIPEEIALKAYPTHSNSGVEAESFHKYLQYRSLEYRQDPPANLEALDDLDGMMDGLTDQGSDFFPVSQPQEEVSTQRRVSPSDRKKEVKALRLELDPVKAEIRSAGLDHATEAVFMNRRTELYARLYDRKTPLDPQQIRQDLAQLREDLNAAPKAKKPAPAVTPTPTVTPTQPPVSPSPAVDPKITALQNALQTGALFKKDGSLYCDSGDWKNDWAKKAAQDLLQGLQSKDWTALGSDFNALMGQHGSGDQNDCAELLFLGVYSSLNGKSEDAKALLAMIPAELRGKWVQALSAEKGELMNDDLKNHMKGSFSGKYFGPGGSLQTHQDAVDLLNSVS